MTAPEQPADPEGDAGGRPPHEVPAVLPEAVRERLVRLAADALGELAAEDVPPALRAVARFTPGKRRLAAAGLAAALETDAAFRQAVGALARRREPGLSAAVEEGVPLPAAPPEDVALLAYLLRPAGWSGRLAAAVADVERRTQAAAAAGAVEECTRLAEQLATERAAARQALEAARAEAEAARAAAAEEVAALRRRVREYGDRAASAERALAAAAVPAQPEPGAGSTAGSAGSSADREAGEGGDVAELRRLRTRVAELEAALASARAASRESRHLATVRLSVLVDSLLRAARGVQAELALPPVEERPADAVEGETATTAPPELQGREPDDPALLDALLRAPLAHLVVDGYNVTKTGYGEQPLQVQRHRLVTGLGALAARTGAEVTVVFDGQDRTLPLAAASPRGVRVLFSRTGEIADDVVRALVAAEPPGRALVVVTSDRAVADDVRAAGARTAPSPALLRLLER